MSRRRASAVADYYKIVKTIKTFPNAKAVLKASQPAASFTSYNVMTSTDFTVANFERIFSASEFWDVLKASFYYTIFGTAGALILGLFAAQIMQKVLSTVGLRTPILHRNVQETI